MKQHPTMPDIFVTKDGRVFQELTPSEDGAGYHQINIGAIRLRRHVIVCETFHGPRPAGKVVRHRDGNPGNDDPRNLAWGTVKENGQDTVDHGRSTRGEKNAQALLTAKIVREIRARRAGGESGTALAIEFGVRPQTICDVVKGRTWKHI